MVGCLSTLGFGAVVRETVGKGSPSSLNNRAEVKGFSLSSGHQVSHKSFEMAKFLFYCFAEGVSCGGEKTGKCDRREPAAQW